MAKFILDMDAFLENLTDSVKMEEKLTEQDPGGRMGTYQEAGIFFAPNSNFKGMTWIPSVEYWEQESIKGHQELAIENTVNIETFSQEKRTQEIGNSTKPVATTLSR